MSVQYAAEASQNFTCPTFNAEPPACTLAVRVTTVPEVTVVAGPLLEVTVSVVAVVVAATTGSALSSRTRRMHRAAGGLRLSIAMIQKSIGLSFMASILDSGTLIMFQSANYARHIFA
jgi:hypothetical protein